MGTQTKAEAFRRCPGCGFDFLTGEGTRGCNWAACPYLPDELDVFCPACNYNFATGEGAPRCGDVDTCEWAIEGKIHAELARRVFGRAS